MKCKHQLEQKDKLNLQMFTCKNCGKKVDMRLKQVNINKENAISENTYLS